MLSEHLKKQKHSHLWTYLVAQRYPRAARSNSWGRLL